MLTDLRGRVAVVTGAASGIGLALTERLLDEGMAVVVADVEELRLARVARRLREGGGRVTAVPTDVADPAAVDGLAAATLRAHGRVDLVCNNAGVAAGGRIWAVDPPTWRWVLGVNLGGVLNGIRAFVPVLLERGEGHVLNTASFAGLVTGPDMGPYAVGKHAVVAASEVLFKDLAATGSAVGVSVLCPGGVVTDLLRSERNRPSWARPSNEPAGATGRDEATAPEPSGEVAATAAGFLAPSVVADHAVDAVRTGRFWVLTHPDRSWAITRRTAQAVAGTNPDPDYPTATAPEVAHLRAGDRGPGRSEP